MMCLTAGSVCLTSCSDSNDFDTNQYKGGVNLNVFGPSPVARGGQLRFLGSGMDQITQIQIPGCDAITDIERINSEEIRVVVPQTALPGHLTLTHAGGEIVTKTTLSYTEPIGIEEITPKSVKPGNALTIKGEYLNLIHEVYFSFLTDSVIVADKDFLKHERHEIVLNVPEEAISGTICISDGKAMPNVIESEEEIDVVLPAVSKPLDLTNYKGGDVVTVVGTDLDLVRSILTPAEDEIDFKYADGKLTFTLPDNITDGAIVAVPASGVKVAIANIGVVVPTELVAEPAKGLRGGDAFAIRGVNMDQVVSMNFPNVADAVTPEITATKITTKWPAAAQSGDVVLTLKSGKTVSVAVETLKPQVTGFNPNPVSAAATLEIHGHNLDLVSRIVFGGGASVDIKDTQATAALITLTCPPTAESGELTFVMVNDEQVKTEKLGVQLPECAYATEVLTEELTAGQILKLAVKNSDKLTDVKVNGQSVQYILNSDVLYINLPQSCGAATKVTLISSNGEITYTYDVIPATHVEKVVFEQVRDLGSWAGEDAGGAFRIYKNAFDGVPAGATMTFYIAPYAFTQIQLNDANWGQMEILKPDQSSTTATWELTAEILNRILTTNDGWSETGMVIQGEGAIVSKVTISWENSLETTIWEGAWENSGWGGNQDLAWGGYDWTTVKPGTKLRIYCTPTVADGEWWCVDVRHGDGWNALPGIGQVDQPAGGVAEYVLTKEILDDLVANGGLIVTGTGYVMNKVTLE